MFPVARISYAVHAEWRVFVCLYVVLY